MIFVFYGEAAIHCGNVMGSYAVAAKLGRPELDRHFDLLKAVSGKPQGKRVGDDGGLDVRVMREVIFVFYGEAAIHCGNETAYPP
jgi:hypothetical protein